MSDDETPRLRPRAEAIMAKGKATVMVIGAVATAATAIWGAVRQPPEPVAKIAYEILREELQKERNQHEEFEKELDELKDRLNECAIYHSQLLLRESTQSKSIPNPTQQLNEVQISKPMPSDKPKSEVLKKRKSEAKALPRASELGL